jgi:hypothetical protein
MVLASLNVMSYISPVRSFPLFLDGALRPSSLTTYRGQDSLVVVPLELLPKDTVYFDS